MTDEDLAGLDPGEGILEGDGTLAGVLLVLEDISTDDAMRAFR